MSARPPYDLLLAAQEKPKADGRRSVVIQDVELPIIEYRGVRVVTLSMVDAVHKRPENTARRSFNEHRSRFIEVEDFFQTTPSELREHIVRFTSEIPINKFVPIQGRGVTLLTESGYMMLVKPLNDDLAWDVQRQLVKSYFAKPAPAIDPFASLPPEQRALIAAMVDNANIKVRQDEQAQALAVQAAVQVQHGAALVSVEQRVGDLADSMLMLSRPAGAESVVHIRERINKLHGLPPRIIDLVLRQSPIAPKPAGMVKHSREEAMGGSYAVYWVKDVSAVFARFVGECTRITATQVTHPYIDGRFKLAPQPARGPGGHLQLIGG